MGRTSRKMDCLKLGWRINDEYLFDGFFGMVVEGKQRIGKSSYVSQSLAESFGEWQYKPVVKCVEPNYESVKPWMVFPPKEFLDLVLHVESKQRAVIWDDAGFLLFALDWYEPFVKSVSRYIQLAGRQFGSLILTTPNKTLISSKVLAALPEMYVCKVVRAGYDSYLNRPRKAKVYERWDYPDGKKGGVKTRWKDHFNAMLPDSFFGWYKPKSEHYMDVGLQILKREVNKITKKMDKKEEAEVMEKVFQVAGDPEKLNELDEVIQNLQQTPQRKT